MSETHESSEIPQIKNPRETPDGGSTPDPLVVGVQPYPPPKGDDGDDDQQ